MYIVLVGHLTLCESPPPFPWKRVTIPNFERTSGPAVSTEGFLGGGGRLFFWTAFSQALTRLLLLAFRLYVNRPLLATVGSCWPPLTPRTVDGRPSSHSIVDHGDGGPAAAVGGRTYNIIALRTRN